MTEAEWLTCTDPTEMLTHLRAKASDRKLRLFAVACCRLFWDEQLPAPTKTAIETNERFADRLASERELSRARSEAHSAGWNARYSIEYQPLPLPTGEVTTVRTVERPSVPDDYLRRLYFAAFMANPPDRLRGDRMPMLQTDPLLAQSGPLLLLDIFGNPFRPTTLAPSLLTSTVVALATSIYQERAFERLPILADALEEAGCDSPAILEHLRGENRHVRGCWVVDAVLGKD